MSRVLLLPFSIIVSLFRLFVQTVMLALGQVWANKTRAMLTALGIIIGVGSVIAVVGGLTGMQKFVLGEFETFGARKMWVWGEVPDSKDTVLSWDDVKLSVPEAEILVSRSSNVELVSPVCTTSMDVRYNDRLERGVTVRGVFPEWFEIDDQSVVYGRELSRIDNEEKRQVCLVNEVAIDEFNLDTDPSGDTILVDGRRFLIIGVLEEKEVSAMFGGGEARSELVIPFNTSKMMNPYTWTIIVCQVASPEVADDALTDAKFILRNARGLSGDDENTFNVQVLQNAISQFNAVAGVIGVIALIVVSISLLVGGIGIMNIMLVSVSERTREIGLRKAVGAKPNVVLLQFLVEAVVLCLVGGIIGLGIGYGLVNAGRFVPNFPLGEAEVPAWATILALSFSGSVGVIFGMFPALKAAKLNPIDALRHE
ncbi:MAG: ABC transporter permease [Planctomycetota bacterium]